jgi:signal peptidase II
VTRGHVFGLVWIAAVASAAMAVRALVQSGMTLYQEIPVIPGFFSLRYTRNPGAAFSLFAGLPAGVRLPFLIGVGLVALAGIAWMYVREGNESRVLRVGLTTLAGGASANLLERFLSGDVVDYLDFFVGSYHWPAFNLADVAINVGVGLLLLDAT